jgi:hypothetical protein
MKYIVVERNEDYKSCLVINEDTTSLSDMWWSCIPYNIDIKELDRVKPKVFDTKSDAMKYKKVLQLQSNKDWRENSHIHRMWGKQKQKWVVEHYDIWVEKRQLIS